MKLSFYSPPFLFFSFLPDPLNVDVLFGPFLIFTLADH